MLNPDELKKKTPQELLELFNRLKNKQNELNNKILLLNNEINHLQKQLEKMKKQALEQYGTDNLQQLRAIFVQTRDNNIQALIDLESKINEMEIKIQETEKTVEEIKEAIS